MGHIVLKSALVVPEEFDPYPGPEVEEDIDGNGDWEQQAIETEAAGAGAVLGKVLIHCSRVEQAA